MLEALVVFLIVVIVLLIIFMVKANRRKNLLSKANARLRSELEHSTKKRIEAEDLSLSRKGEIDKLKKGQGKTITEGITRVETVLGDKSKRRSYEVKGLQYAIKILKGYNKE